MGQFSTTDYLAMLSRTAGKRRESLEKTEGAVAETRERDLHEAIIQYCNSQWPRWKFVHSRMDKRSTVDVGSHDFTIFLPKSRIICVECKTKTGKLSREQSGWEKEMEMLEHRVHVVRSFDEFLSLIDSGKA